MSAKSNLTLREAVALAVSGGTEFRRASDPEDEVRWFIPRGGGVYDILEPDEDRRTVEAGDMSVADYLASDYTVMAFGCDESDEEDGDAAPVCGCGAGSGGRLTFGEASGTKSETSNVEALGLACASDPCGCAHAVVWGEAVIVSMVVDYLEVGSDASGVDAECLEPGEVFYPSVQYTWRPPTPAPPGAWAALLIRGGETLAMVRLGVAPALEEGEAYGVLTIESATDEAHRLTSAELAGSTQKLTLRLVNLDAGTGSAVVGEATFPAVCSGSGSGSA